MSEQAKCEVCGREKTKWRPHPGIICEQIPRDVQGKCRGDYRCPEIGYERERDAAIQLRAEVASLAAERDALKGGRWFPLLITLERGDYDKPPHKVQYLQCPWSVAEKAYAAYVARYGTGQSIERLAQRGGFGQQEMDLLHPRWREETDENALLRKRAESAEAELAASFRTMGWETNHGSLSERLKGVPQLLKEGNETESERDRLRTQLAAMEKKP